MPTSGSMFCAEVNKVLHPPFRWVLLFAGNVGRMNYRFTVCQTMLYVGAGIARPPGIMHGFAENHGDMIISLPDDTMVVPIISP